jgi:uncharacterized membrane protein YdjX (TVP38/TMEM64 family)
VSRPLYQRKRAWTALLLLCAAILAFVFRSDILAFVRHYRWEDLRDAILATGPMAAPVLCILLQALVTVLFLPTTVVSILIVFIYGPWLGLPICVAGLGLGIATSFLVARYVLREWIERRIGHTKLYRRIEEHLHAEGWKLVMFTRMLPVHPFATLNYAYGLTRISFWSFLAASVVGILPNTAVLLWTAHAAGQIAVGKADWRIMLFLLSGALVFGVVAWLPRFLRQNMPGAIPAPGDDMRPDDPPP